VSFNLLDEPWIPVLRLTGQSDRVGIRKALLEAGNIRQIAASNPMDRVALLRFLLAILYWCKGNPAGPAETDRIWAGGQFPAEWFGKLDDRQECFELLGDGKRFYQDESCNNRALKDSINYLIHEVPSGTNKWHFRHATDLVDGLCPACCAMGLIRLPVFATSAGRGKSPGINAKPPLYVFPVGMSLAVTIAHSWLPTQGGLGTPEWETPGENLPKKGPVPLLVGMTSLPRRIWLADPEDPPSTCILCGRMERLIRRCAFDGKGTSKADDRIWRDPHVIYDTTSDGEVRSLQTSNALGRSDAAAGQWARQLAGILRGSGAGGAKAICVIGFSTVQNDKYLEATEHLITLSTPSSKGQEAIATLDRWQEEGDTLARNIHRKMPPSSRKHLEVRPVVDAVRPHVEAKAATRATELMAGIDGAWQRVAAEYRPLVGAVVNSLSPGFTTRALDLRNRIAQTFRDITPKPPTEAPQRKGKKGGQS
jgi:hypothetical protein